MFLDYLRGAKVVPALVAPKPNPVEQLAIDYAQFMTQERALAPATVHNNLLVMRRFLAHLSGTIGLKLHRLKTSDILEFILGDTQKACAPRASITTSSLRSFLGYLYHCGTLPVNLASAVPAVAQRSYTYLPYALEAAAVEKLLNSCARSTVIGRRDYAILLLLARLGLRAGEVVNMTLEDIDWAAGELLIRGKGGRQDRMPLPHEVGQALAEYLKHGRPGGTCRRVFLRCRAPRQGLTDSSAIRSLVSRALTRAQLNPLHRGAHVLRHSLATQMLRRGATLVQIAQLLRHHRAQTTEIYAKVDLAALRKLALPWPGRLP